MYNNSSAVGNIGEAVAIAEFSKMKIPVLIPFGQNTPYDLVIHYKGKFLKVQCKTTESVMSNNTMRFGLHRTNGFTGEHRKYDENEVDLFFLYCVENGYIGLIKMEEAAVSKLIIRIAAAKNNQSVGVHMASDYEISKVLSEL